MIRRTVLDLGKQPDTHALWHEAPADQLPRAKKANSMQVVLELLGHSPNCVRLARAGLVTSCGCQLKPADDPAVVVGLAVHFARSAIVHRVPLPASVAERLAEAVEAGDQACRLVAVWLADLGLLDMKPQWLAGKDSR
ncbi:hypothetical protein [Aminobacter sp. AP02]|uniref:hypothetical protein n=1 Tax=Aminobacter sp. AP02 TaxID=2135737 RepID=UPI0011B1F723|nr:hypothetical protein [Aminobacter sp. AP02]